MMLHYALKYVRKFHEVSANELASRTGLSTSYISEIESGKKRINQDTLETYSRAFEMPISSFYLIAESMNAAGDTKHGVLRRKVAKIIEWIAED